MNDTVALTILLSTASGRGKRKVDKMVYLSPLPTNVKLRQIKNRSSYPMILQNLRLENSSALARIQWNSVIKQIEITLEQQSHSFNIYHQFDEFL